MYRSSIDVPGPVVDELSELAKRFDIFLVVGCSERGGNTLYCSVIFFDPVNGFLGKHRKIMPTMGERTIWGVGDGSNLPVFNTSIGNIGAVVCWENYMPLLRTYMYQQNIQLYCVPIADDREARVSSMRHIAQEGRCYVLCSCHFTRRKDYPDDYPTCMSEDPEAVYTKGGSCIINPLGEIIAGPDFEGETILYADIDLSEIIQSRWDFDPVGHYSRPDIFKLTVNCEDRSL